MKDPTRTFYPPTPKQAPKKKMDKDLNFKAVQLAKKARNLAKKKANPLVFKAKAK